MEVVIAIVSLAVGGVVGYLLAERKCRGQNGAAEAAAAAGEQRCADLSARLDREAQQTESLRQIVSGAEKDAATLAAQLQSAQDNIAEQKRLLDDAHDQLRAAFASVSQEALAKNNEAFLALAKERFGQLSTEATGSLEQRKAEIEGLLKPMQQLLGQYQVRVSEIERSRVESYSMLREQLGVLAETQRTLNTQTHQLVSALRRPNARGQWGEITLKRLVELAGMSNRCDFVEQMTVERRGDQGGDTDDGRQRPDVLINLPGGRQIVIDCKATLDAFLDAAAAPDEDTRKLCMQRHCAQVRARARDLAQKSYWSQFARSPEFVVMFLPGEAFLYAAVEHDGNLIEDCLKNRVIVATPTTLIALLKAIEFGWRQEEVTQNAEEIRELGKQLYERIATLAGHFARLGANLDTVVSTYNQAVGSLETRVLVTARKISEMGARTDKELPEPQLIDTRPRELSASVQVLTSSEE
ncbi:MAG: DNA recombination protein RmuC [Tepidisphaeraceae bacterium]